MSKIIELINKELLILQQTVIRYLKITEGRINFDILNDILKKLGVITHSILIKEAKERAEAK